MKLAFPIFSCVNTIGFALFSAALSQVAFAHINDRYFDRIATFPVYENLDLGHGDKLEDETVAEIVAASKDGKTLIYTNGEKKRLGFVDIRNPAKPAPAGFLPLGGEPTSVAVYKHFALVGVNTCRVRNVNSTLKTELSITSCNEFYKRPMGLPDCHGADTYTPRIRCCGQYVAKICHVSL